MFGGGIGRDLKGEMRLKDSIILNMKNNYCYFFGLKSFKMYRHNTYLLPIWNMCSNLYIYRAVKIFDVSYPFSNKGVTQFYNCTRLYESAP